MRSLHTKLALSALGIAVLVTPALAQRREQRSSQQQTIQSQNPNEVIVNGRVVGADPDPQIRTELSRDADPLQGD